MRRVAVEAIADGMVLARAVEDRLGRVLLNKGDTLQTRYGEKFRDWGIEEVWAEGEADPAADLALLSPGSSPTMAGPELLALTLKVESRFAGYGEAHPVMMGLKLLALKHLSGEPPKA